MVEDYLNLLRATVVVSKDLIRTYEPTDNILNLRVEDPVCVDLKKWALVRELANLPWFVHSGDVRNKRTTRISERHFSTMPQLLFTNTVPDTLIPPSSRCDNTVSKREGFQQDVNKNPKASVFAHTSLVTTS